MNRRKTDNKEPIKLYEFTYQNEDFTKRTEVKRRLRNLLEMEAYAQQWAQGFKLKIAKQTLDPIKSYPVYYCEVYGRYDDEC